jgi:hypothetical protein
LDATFIDGIVGAFRLAGTAIDTIICDIDSHIVISSLIVDRKGTVSGVNGFLNHPA